MTSPRVIAETQIPTRVDGFSVTVAAVAEETRAPRVSLTLFLPGAGPRTVYALSPAAARRFASALRSVLVATEAKLERATGGSITAPVHSTQLDALERVRVGVMHDNGKWFVVSQDDNIVPCLILAPLESAGTLVQALADMAAVADGKRERLEMPM